MDVRPSVAAAQAERRPVVALESALISHGLPAPANLETALAMESAVREAGAVPATVGVAGGRVIVGLDRRELRLFAEAEVVDKISSRDLAAAVAAGGLGGTTVAATLWAAVRAGIRVMATGGIGGVHRGGEASLDVSADLRQLGRTRGAVVCSGAKVILDLGRTLEALETLGVPVLGFGSDHLPAFYSTASPHPVSWRVETVEEAADVLEAHWRLGLKSGLVIANPPPSEQALEGRQVEAWIEESLIAAAAEGIAGAEVTPYLLESLARLSRGRTVEVNRALLVANAELAARIAVAWASRSSESRRGPGLP